MTTKDRIRGCMIGGAVGDALGWPIEFKTERQIFNKYWPDGIHEYDLNAAGEAEITDDTQMSLYTANGILCWETAQCVQNETRLPRHFVAMAYQDWLYTQEAADGHETSLRPCDLCWLNAEKGLWHRRGPGVTCLQALRLQNGAAGRIRDYINAEQNNSKGCGGIMRVAPMGLRKWDDIKALDYEGAQLAAITHGHPLGYMPAAVLVHIINRIVYLEAEGMPLRDIIVEARDVLSDIFPDDPFLPKLRGIIDRAVELAERSEDSDLDNIHKLGEGWVGEETLGIALYCALKYQDDFSAGIIAAVNHMGDSDSTGAVTGNILGALLGYEGIEEKWKKCLELKTVILEIADDLARGVPFSEAEKCEDPEWLLKYGRI